MKLREWLIEHDFKIDGDFRHLLAEEGIAASHEVEDWSIFFGDGWLIENTIQGTRLDQVGAYAVQSWPTHVEVRDVCGENTGMSPAETADYVREIGLPVLLRMRDER